MTKEAPVIFLDIDGVLATDKQFFMNRQKYQRKNPEAAELGAPYPFDPGCVERLNTILEQTGARIVISSDWRLHWGIADLCRIFRMNGVSRCPDDVTENLPMMNLERARAGEIGVYVNDHALTSYVVIDDLNVGMYMSTTGDDDKFFMTRSSEGLKQVGLASKIIDRLNGF
jgi:hypothetical protein